MKRIILTWLLFTCSCFAHSAGDPYSQVDPFIGTKPTQAQDAGHTLPGAVRPFGMLYWSPDTAHDRAAPGQYVDENHFQYDIPAIRGFSLTHLSGEGCGIFGDVPFLPALGTPGESSLPTAAEHSAAYRTADAVASPGYYAVKLQSGITVRLAADVRSGIAEVVFPKSADSHTILLDLGRNLNSLYDADVKIDGREISGSVTGGDFCGGRNRYRVYFVMQFDKESTSAGTSAGEVWQPGQLSADGPHTRAFVSFPANTDKLLMKAAISYVSVANARNNLQSEIAAWDFEKVRASARTSWSDVLSSVQVKGGTEAQRKVFYSALYHALIHPSVFNDVNGEYLGFDNQVHRVTGRQQYANFSGWDIYRDQVQLIAMLFPKVASDIAQSFVTDAEQAGRLPKWSVANGESNVMVGDPADEILASIYAFGAREFDVTSALKAMVRGADTPDLKFDTHPERPDLRSYLERGYVYYEGDDSHDEEGTENNGSASVTLEYQSADFTIAQMAKALGDTADADKFLSRSADWRKSFDPDTRYIRARDKEGNFRPGFDPAHGHGFVEGNSAQYTWMIPYDLHGIITAIGGPDAANARLDDYFSHYGGGQEPYFNINNEPSFADPWIYNWTGHPWRAQEVIRKTLSDLFTVEPDGLPGNDDLGATSAWVVFAELGIYPAIPAVGGVTFNTPTFPEAVLKLGDHSLRILAPNAGQDAYIKSVSVDGRPLHRWWISWEEMAKASALQFSLSAQPSKEAGGSPPSFSPENTSR